MSPMMKIRQEPYSNSKPFEGTSLIVCGEVIPCGMNSRRGGYLKVGSGFRLAVVGVFSPSDPANSFLRETLNVSHRAAFYTKTALQ